MSKKIDLTGQQYGKLTVIRYTDNGKWLCRCECGKETIVQGKTLKNGRTKSCGCLKHPDLTGEKFGKLTVIQYSGNSKWLCRCECGNEKEIYYTNLKTGKTISCGCFKNSGMMRRRDLTGQKFGMLTAIKYVGNIKWLCRCDCGNEKEIHTAALTTGKTISCGCLNKAVTPPPPRNFLSLEGQKFGMLTVVKYAGNSKWLCHCDCGNEAEVITTSLTSGNTKSCGCLFKSAQSRRRDLTGQKFGMLTVVKYSGNSKWLCHCECGNEKEVYTGNLTSGNTKSCGCGKNQKRRKTNEI